MHFENIDPFEIDNGQIVRLVKNIVQSENGICGEISIILCSDVFLADINRKYLGRDYLTDIITFDYSGEGIVSGDLFISFERVSENAVSYNVTAEEELRRVIIHGVLHLLGYKDEAEQEKQKMKEMEDFYLK
ncbi:MAG: rRNA maturation RNase YbeY [Bacteroidetes bacterium]|nr:rRNA maturation RNase YbeY [Bacteroidota bacterium]